MMKTLKNALRRRRLARAGLDIEIQIPTAQYGNGGGSWMACPDSIHPDAVVYSFGIGRDLSFDLALMERHAACVHAFDPTPASVQWVRRQTLPPAFSLHEIGLAAFDGTLDFCPPRKASSAHFTPVQRYRFGSTARFKAPVQKLTTIMRALGHTRIDLLKIDIEGGEYDVIDNIVSETPCIGQLLVEFHHNYPTIPFGRTVDAVRALRQVGFKVFAISERTYEMSLINVLMPPFQMDGSNNI